MNMCEEFRPLLNAYLDNELQGARLQQLENHLVTCEACRAELEQLRQVSNLLHTVPTPQTMPVDHFVANLTLKLPRRPVTSRRSVGVTWIWWLAPAGLLFLWFFVQTVFTISGTLTIASRAVLPGNATTWLPVVTDHTLWFSALTDILGNQPGGITEAAFSFLDQVNVIGASLAGQFLIEAVIAVLYWTWLIIWWQNRRPRIMNRHAVISQP
jgi:predicted anti-sigma-YlaC factor YlaD